MAKCYIIAMGGTGCRVMRSFYHLSAAGAFNGYSFKFMCVDSDTANGDKGILSETIVKYNNLNNYFHIFPEIALGGDGGFWSPLQNINDSMAQNLNSPMFSDDAKAVFNMLYTPNEQEKTLSGGFYGHTSIGSFFMLKSIIDDNGNYTETWHNFFGDIDPTEDKIFIIGSLFGGTGASGIPTLARIIHDNPSTSTAKIGAMLVMPYFKMQNEKNDTANIDKIDWRLFTSKVQSALSFYEDQNFNNTFQTMYFLGENKDKFMFVSNEPEGVAQRNKANHIEALAAASVLDFMKVPLDSSFEIKMYRDKEADAQLFNTINPGRNIYDLLVRFFAFSVVHTRYINPAVIRHCGGEFKISEGWITGYSISAEDSKTFFEYCLKYKEWIYEIIVNSKESGKFATIFSAEENTAGESCAGWLKANNYGGSNNYKELYYPNELPCEEKKGIFSKRATVIYNFSVLNCLETVADTEMIRLKTVEQIINELSVKSPDRKSDASAMVVLFHEICNTCIKEI